LVASREVQGAPFDPLQRRLRSRSARSQPNGPLKLTLFAPCRPLSGFGGRGWDLAALAHSMHIALLRFPSRIYLMFIASHPDPRYRLGMDTLLLPW
jgi:hypothetical protein